MKFLIIQKKSLLCLLALLFSIVVGTLPSWAMGDIKTLMSKPTADKSKACQHVLKQFNEQVLNQALNLQELIEVVQTLRTHQHLPSQYVTKKEARALGWRPGQGFNQITALKNKAIGGDFFANYEKRLPKNDYKEADLDYQGGKRNAKRLVYQANAKNLFVTIDHYSSFTKVPECH